MFSQLGAAWLLSYPIAGALTLSFGVPATPPENASKQLLTAPVAVSLEFFAFPEYMNDVAATTTCLENLKELTGTWPPMRIGGTTQDRATYNASSPDAVTYAVDDPADAPETLTYGPSFISLASKYAGRVILGLNRRLNDIENTISAARLAVKEIGTLDAIELGNEPNFFGNSDPIASGASWTAAADYASQVKWQDTVCGNLSATDIISAGVYFVIAELQSVILSALMSHSAIASQISPYAAEISAAAAIGKPHIFGETNSATQGGGGVSEAFGAALWVVDYVMQLVTMGSDEIYFHQGTIENCPYCWWGRQTTGPPYYGAYFATMALANADKIAPLDDQSTAYAAYAIYKDDSPVRVLLYNSDYYTSGTRPSETFTLTGLSSSTVTAKRLTAAYATSKIDQGESPTVAGQTFGNGDCTVQGTKSVETAIVSGGKAAFTVGASEALLVYL